MTAKPQQSEGPLSFIYDHKRAVQAVNYFARKCPPQGFTKMKALKLLFNADKLHLNKYGRTISGDRYYAMEDGPVASEFYESIRHNFEIPTIQYRKSYLHVDGRDISSVREVDFSEFSKSDVEVLKEIVRLYGDKSAEWLSDRSHEEKAYIESWNNRGLAKSNLMSIEALFDEGQKGSKAYRHAHEISQASHCLK